MPFESASLTKCCQWRGGAASLQNSSEAHIQGLAKKLSLGCVRRAPRQEGGKDVGITQPRDHALATCDHVILSCTFSKVQITNEKYHVNYVVDQSTTCN